MTFATKAPVMLVSAVMSKRGSVLGSATYREETDGTDLTLGQVPG